MKNITILALLSLVFLACGDDDSSSASASAGNNSTNNVEGSNNGSGAGFMCGDHGPGCLSEEMNDGFVAKTCIEFLDPVPRNAEEDCVGNDVRQGQMVTFLPEGCPETVDLAGSCLTVNIFDFGKVVTSFYHYV